MTSEHAPTNPLVIVVMGVSGCGKSTVAAQLANLLQAHFKDGDELHPASNIEKMGSGTPLTDEDREPWLVDVAHYAQTQAGAHGICVVACSALKHRYRQILNPTGDVKFVYLHGSSELIASRMHARTGHFMPETLLASQFATLEDPQQEANVITVSIDQDALSIAREAVNKLHASGLLSASDVKA